jgi:hypothetical protein
VSPIRKILLLSVGLGVFLGLLCGIVLFIAYVDIPGAECAMRNLADI